MGLGWGGYWNIWEYLGIEVGIEREDGGRGVLIYFLFLYD